MRFVTKYLLALFFCFTQRNVCIAQDTLNSSLIEQRSFQLYSDKNWKELIPFVNKALSLDFDYFYLRMRIGIAYYEKKNYCQAEAHFKSALEFSSNDELALEYLYYCYLFTGRIEEARKISKQFDDSLKEKMGIKKPFALEYINLEGLTKIDSKSVFLDPETNTNQKYFNSLSLYQFSFKHRVNNHFSLLHAFSLFQQQYNSAILTIVNPQAYAKNEVQQLQYYLKATIPLKRSWLLMPAFDVINSTYIPDTSPYAKEEQRLEEEQQTLEQQIQTLTKGQQTFAQQQAQLQQQQQQLQQQINNLQSMQQPLPPLTQQQLRSYQTNLLTVQNQLTSVNQQINNNTQQLRSNQQLFDTNSQSIKSAQEAQKATTTQNNYYVFSLAIKKNINKLSVVLGATGSNVNNIKQYNHFVNLAYSVFGNSKLLVGCTTYLHTRDNYSTFQSSFFPYLYLEPIKRISITSSYFLNNKYNIIEENGFLVNNAIDLTRSRLSFMCNIACSKYISIYSLYQRENKTETIQNFDYHFNNIIFGIKITPNP